jgi:hypothetical protein
VLQLVSGLDAQQREQWIEQGLLRVIVPDPSTGLAFQLEWIAN